VHWAADCRTSHFPFFSVQVTAEAPWPQVEFAMQFRIAELQSLAKPLATMTLWMQSTYAEWLVNELQGHWLSNWDCKEHRTASQSTASAGGLGNSTNAVRNATNNGKASFGVKGLGHGPLCFDLPPLPHMRLWHW